MAFINKQDTNGTKGTLTEGEFGYDAYTAGGDRGRVYIGTNSGNVSLATKAEVDTKLPSASYTAADVLAKIKTVDGAGSGLDADLLDGLSSESFMRSDTSDTFIGQLSVGNTNNRSSGIYGIYDSTRIGHIWSMGTGYTIPDDGSTFGSLYGLAYKHVNNTTGGTMGGGHQVCWVTNGTPRVSLGESGIWTSGNVTGVNFYGTTFYGNATSANYADLAEKYISDVEYPIGTVVEVGGEKEITIYKGGALAGVISGNPGLMLNSESEGQFVALKGKVPVFCEGDVKKGQYCLAANGGKVTGHDYVDANYTLKVVGVALEDSKDGTVIVKV